MVSDEEIVSGLEMLLRQADFTVTTSGDIRQQLERKLGVDLSHKRAFIRNHIDLLVQTKSFPTSGHHHQQQQQQHAHVHAHAHAHAHAQAQAQAQAQAHAHAQAQAHVHAQAQAQFHPHHGHGHVPGVGGVGVSPFPPHCGGLVEMPRFDGKGNFSCPNVKVDMPQASVVQELPKESSMDHNWNFNIFSSNFLSQLISQKLNHANYLTWKHQIVLFIKSHRLYEHLNGTTPAPPEWVMREVKNATGQVQEAVAEVKPEYETWMAHDQSLVAYITSTLLEEVLAGVDDDLSALELWNVLATTYSQHPCVAVAVVKLLKAAAVETYHVAEMVNEIIPCCKIRSNSGAAVEDVQTEELIG
ncbi:hypothetical protein EJ110_NYTH50989 [Nymphaea thermarum]|nr:hypothetical protein EJ110_NYTH50989 [Nymphaea thermarum]